MLPSSERQALCFKRLTSRLGIFFSLTRTVVVSIVSSWANSGRRNDGRSQSTVPAVDGLFIPTVSKLRAGRELVSGRSIALLAVSFAIILRRIVGSHSVNAVVVWLEDGLAVTTRLTIRASLMVVGIHKSKCFVSVPTLMESIDYDMPHWLGSHLDFL